MFGIGTPELLVILILALVVVGPQRLPELGRAVGRALREFRKVQDEVRGMVKTGMVKTGIGDDLDDVRKELRGTADELKRTSQEITGGVKEATNVKPLLPSTRRGADRTRRSGSTPPAEAEPAPSAETSSTSEPEPDSGSATSD
jgi:Tat protein translocase TatB subunit